MVVPRDDGRHDRLGTLGLDAPGCTINAGEMTSFNHYALGAVADWIYQVVGGIRPRISGYAKVPIEPVPGPGITWAKTTYESVRGTISGVMVDRW